MHTIKISISELDYNKFGFKKENLSFSEFVDIIQRHKMREKLLKSVQIAEKNGLSKMTMEEIDEEIRDVRNNAEGHN
jgi:hypothetical protein